MSIRILLYLKQIGIMSCLKKKIISLKMGPYRVFCTIAQVGPRHIYCSRSSTVYILNYLRLLGSTANRLYFYALNVYLHLMW